MQEDALPAGANVVVIDDLIATGGSAFAAHQLVDQAKAKVIQNLFVVDVRLSPFLAGNLARLARTPGEKRLINLIPLLTRARWCPKQIEFLKGTEKLPVPSYSIIKAD